MREFSLSTLPVLMDHPPAKAEALARCCEGASLHCRHTLEWPSWPVQRSGPWGRARSVLADLSRPLWGESMPLPSELRYNLPPCRTKRFQGHSFLPLSTLKIHSWAQLGTVFVLLRIYTFNVNCWSDIHCELNWSWPTTQREQMLRRGFDVRKALWVSFSLH